MYRVLAVLIAAGFGVVLPVLAIVGAVNFLLWLLP